MWRWMWGIALLGCGPEGEGPPPGGVDPEDVDSGAEPAVDGVGNVLVVLLDDVGTDALALYAEHPDAPTMPTLEALAAEGVLFRNVWAAPSCSPARALLLTGRHGRRTGIGRSVLPTEDRVGLPVGGPTLPAVAALAGAASAVVGKWHLSSLPTQGTAHARDFGFDRSLVTLGNLHDEHTVVGMEGSYRDWEWIRDGRVERGQGFLTDATVDEALALLPGLPEPWVLYLPLNAPHGPYDLPPGVTSLDAPSLAARFHAQLTYADGAIGRLLDGLGPARARTTVIVAGDNGTPVEVTTAPFDPEHAKLTMGEGGLGVPLIVSGPVVGRPGTESRALVGLIDLLPTIAELLGVADAARGLGEVDGCSLAPLLRDPEAAGCREIAYAEYFEPNGVDVERRTDWQAARDHRWKLVRGVAGGPFLYDLEGRHVEGEPVAPESSPDAWQAWTRLSAFLDGRAAALGR